MEEFRVLNKKQSRKREVSRGIRGKKGSLLRGEKLSPTVVRSKKKTSMKQEKSKFHGGLPSKSAELQGKVEEEPRTLSPCAQRGHPWL